MLAIGNSQAGSYEKMAEIWRVMLITPANYSLADFHCHFVTVRIQAVCW
jgi:hypothetical protein